MSVYWTGLKVGNLEIEELLGEGAFSIVYRARNSTTGDNCAVKVANQFGSTGGATGVYQSRALERITSGFVEMQPNSKQLLKIQYERMAAQSSSPAFVKVDELVDSTAGCYMLMEFVPGKNLRSLIQEHKADLTLVRKLVGVCESLEAGQKERLLHGDIKPENILVNQSGAVVLIDPGYYGTLQREDGRLVNCVITTPTYYPLINADDLLAVGLVLWEIATGEVLLDRTVTGNERVGAKLEEKIVMTERTGNHFYSPLRAVQDPRLVNPEMSAALARVVAKAIGLEFNNGTAELTERYPNFRALGQDLDKVGVLAR